MITTVNVPGYGIVNVEALLADNARLERELREANSALAALDSHYVPTVLATSRPPVPQPKGAGEQLSIELCAMAPYADGLWR